VDNFKSRLSLSRETKRRDGTDGLGQKTGKKKFALLMSDPLMDWFRTAVSSAHELTLIYHESLSEYYVQAPYISQSASLNEIV